MSVWIDEAKIMVGQQFKNKIRIAISNVDYMIVVVSKSSNASPWVRFEIDSAIMREKGEGRDIILPVLLEQVDPPEGLESRLFVDLSNEDRYQENYSQLAHRLGRFGDINTLDSKAIPAGIEIWELENKLHITREWKDLQLLLPLYRIAAYHSLAIALVCFYFSGAAIRLSGGLDYLALFVIVVLILFFIKSLYEILVANINKQTIELTPKHLEVKHGPLPSQLQVSCSIPSSMIESIECVEGKFHLTKQTIIFYRLCAVCANGEMIDIPTGTLIYNSDQGIFLRDTIISYLEVNRTNEMQIATQNTQEPTTSEFEHEKFVISNLRVNWKPKETRQSVWLGDFSRIGNTLALHRFRSGAAFGIVGVVLIILQYQQQGSLWNNAAITHTAGMLALTSFIIAFNSRILLQYTSLFFCFVGPLVMLLTWYREGLGYIAVVGITTVVCIESLYRLSRMPTQYFYPDLIEKLPSENHYSNNPDDALIIDVCISRNKDAQSREKLCFESSTALIEKLIEWRGASDFADICLTWGETTADASVIVRNSIFEHVGLMYLLDVERESAWKQMKW